MRQITIAIIIICLSSDHLSAQVKKQAAPKENDDAQVFKKVENEAHTDQALWDKYVTKCIQLPDSVWKTIPSGKYSIVVSFIVNIYGDIIDVKADNDPGYGLAAIAIKAVRNYRGKWYAASQCGRLVKAYRKQPFVFSIPGHE
jgi:protein TonB